MPSASGFGVYGDAFLYKLLGAVQGVGPPMT